MTTMDEIERASREARRRVRTSQGIYLLSVGALLTVFGACWLLAGRRADWLLGVTLLATGGAGLLIPLIVRRSRARRGVYVVPPGELVRGPGERIPLPVLLGFGAGLLLTLGTALFLALAKTTPWAEGGERLLMGTALGCCAAMFLGSFYRFRLWEELLLAAGCVAAGALGALGLPWGWAFLAIGVPALFTGASYQLRWTRWVRHLEQA